MPYYESAEAAVYGSLIQRGYRIDVVTLDDGQFYWHVWRHGERINGGLSERWADARERATQAARQDVSHREIPYR